MGPAPEQPKQEPKNRKEKLIISGIKTQETADDKKINILELQHEQINYPCKKCGNNPRRDHSAYCQECSDEHKRIRSTIEFNERRLKDKIINQINQEKQNGK